ncbi:MAG: hypothetical protein AAFW75_15735 [Cyanobacteria bacterium J06636_16]
MADEVILSAVSTRLQSVDATLDRVAQQIEANNYQIEATNRQIEANSYQLGMLTEGLQRLENLVEHGFDRVERNFGCLENLIQQQHEVTLAQANHIDRLIALLEKSD